MCFATFPTKIEFHIGVKKEKFSHFKFADVESVGGCIISRIIYTLSRFWWGSCYPIWRFVSCYLFTLLFLRHLSFCPGVSTFFVQGKVRYIDSISQIYIWSRLSDVSQKMSIYQNKKMLYDSQWYNYRLTLKRSGCKQLKKLCCLQQ